MKTSDHTPDHVKYERFCIVALAGAPAPVGAGAAGLWEVSLTGSLARRRFLVHGSRAGSGRQGLG